MKTNLSTRIFHVQLRNVFTRINSFFPMRSVDILFHFSRDRQKENVRTRMREFSFLSLSGILRIYFIYTYFSNIACGFYIFNINLVGSVFLPAVVPAWLSRTILFLPSRKSLLALHLESLRRDDEKISFEWLIRSIRLECMRFQGEERKTSKITQPINQFFTNSSTKPMGHE